MAEVISAVRGYILSKTLVTDIISQRMYFFRLKQGAVLPAATIAKVSTNHIHTLSDRSGLVSTRLQIECFSTNYLQAETLAAAIYKCGITAVRGVTNSVDIRGVTVEDGQRNYTIDARDGGDDHTYVTQFDLMVSYLE